jgi:hypothetical protein
VRGEVAGIHPSDNWTMDRIGPAILLFALAVTPSRYPGQMRKTTIDFIYFSGSSGSRFQAAPLPFQFAHATLLMRAIGPISVAQAQRFYAGYFLRKLSKTSRLLIALWRYAKDGVIPEGAKMKTA